MPKPPVRRSNIIDVTPSRRAQAVEQKVEDEALQPLEENVARFLTQTSQGVEDAEVKVYQVGGAGSAGGRPLTGQGAKPPSMRDVFLYKCSPEEFDETLLQAAYGAGAYRIRMYGTDSGGNYGLLVNKVMEIGALPVWKKNEVLEKAAGPAPVQREEGSAIAQAIIAALAPVMSAQTQMLSKLAESGTNRKALLEEIQVIAQMFRPGAASADPTTQLGAMLTLARQFQRDSNDERDPDMAGLHLIGRALDTFGPLFRNSAQTQLPAPVAPAAAPSASTASAASQSEEEKMNLVQRAALAGQMAILLNAAKANSPHESYADIVVDLAPDEVLTLLESETWFDALVKLEPEFAGYRPWCDKVRARVLEILAELPEEEEAGKVDTQDAASKNDTPPGSAGAA